MKITIGSNIPSLAVQRRLDESSIGLSKAHERLSSGLRINRASDDAAGLAIADNLSSKSRVYGKGLQNLNDGISVVSIADAALNELTNIATRMLELAEQSANGTYSSSQRDALDKEAQALAKEYFRISRSTQFNGRNLFDGSVQGLSLQAGYGASAVLGTSLGGKLGTGSFNAPLTGATGASPGEVAAGDLNADGNQDIVTSNNSGSVSILLGNGDGSFRSASNMALPNSSGIALGDINGDGILDMVSTQVVNHTLSAFLGNGDGTFKTGAAFGTGSNPLSVALGDVNGDGTLDAITANDVDGSVSILLGNGNGTFKSKADITTSGIFANSVSLADLNKDGTLDIVSTSSNQQKIFILLGNGNGTFQARPDLASIWPESAVIGDVNGDGTPDIVAVNSNDWDNVSIFIGNGNGTFKTPVDYDIGAGFWPTSIALADLDGDGGLDIITGNLSSSDASVLLGNGNGTFRSPVRFATGTQPSSVATADMNGDGVLDIVASNSADSTVSVLLGITRDGISPINPFSLRTKAEALQTLAPLKRTLDNLGVQRGVLGAFEARVVSAVSGLNAMVENSKAAESRIRNVDVAEESASLMQKAILQKAGAAILGQANQMPGIVLSLLNSV